MPPLIPLERLSDWTEDGERAKNPAMLLSGMTHTWQLHSPQRQSFIACILNQRSMSSFPQEKESKLSEGMVL